MRDTRDVVRFVLLAALLGCSGSSKPAPASPATPVAHDDPTCPVLVAGTSITVEDTDGGAAFVFVTTGDAAAVRTRANALAEMHNAHAGSGHEMGHMIATKSTAASSELPNGARVTFTAASPGEAGALQSELRMHAQHLAGGTCEMAM